MVQGKFVLILRLRGPLKFSPWCLVFHWLSDSIFLTLSMYQAVFEKELVQILHFTST